MDEEQFLLRLPQALVEEMRFALSSTKKRDAAGDDKKASRFDVNFKDERNAVLKVDGKEYPASLMDLPCLVETHKTADKRTFYKSGDVHQVLVVRMPDEPAPTSHVLTDGLTPAAKNAGKRLAARKPVFSAKQVRSVEQRVKYVIEHKVKFVAKKDDPAPPVEEEEVVIEEETAEQPAAATSTAAGAAAAPAGATAAAVSAAVPAAPASVAAKAETAAKVETTAKVETAAKAEAVETKGGGAETGVEAQVGAATPGGKEASEEMVDTKMSSDVQPSPSADTPMAEGGDDEEEEDDDDFAEMAGELMEEDEEEEAKKRIERANIEQKIVEVKKKISEIEESAAKAPNAVLRQRILAKRGDLQTELARLEAARAQLGGDG